ncbi:hypothetical protein H0H87_008789, partial [Tephrocybe sp. NHM501043]
MPAEIIADAAEPATASGNVDSTENNDTQSSPLTSESSCESDRDDDRDNINVETGLSSVQDNIRTRTSKPSMRDVRRAYVEEAYDEEAPTRCTQEQDHIIAEARNNMTTEERERVDRRAENVRIAKSMHVQEDEPGEPSQAKGKGVDPRNWGNIHLDNLEIDPQLQQEMLAEFYARRNPDKHQTSPDSTTAPADLENERLPASKNGDETDGSSDEQTEEVSREEIRAYIKDKKRLLCELDRYRKKEKSSPRKKKDRAGSVPLSDELAALISKVAEGSKAKQKYKPRKSNEKLAKRTSSTQPITQITSKSALGRAFERLNKKHKNDSSDDPSSSEPPSESDETESSSDEHDSEKDDSSDYSPSDKGSNSS